MPDTRLLLVLAVALLVLAACGHDSASPASATLPPDFALRSTAITLPDDSGERYPLAPGAEAMDNNCRACHAPAMVLVQPPLPHAVWAKEIDKMRTVFKAPVPEADVPRILAYLDALSARQKAENAGAGVPLKTAP